MRQQRLWISLGFALACYLLLFLIYVLPGSREAVTALDTGVLKWMYAFRGPLPVDERIRVVGIDEVDIRNFELDLQADYPFDWKWYAHLLRKLADSGARLAVFDIVFANEGKRPGQEAAELRDAILYAQERGCEVVVASALETTQLLGATAVNYIEPHPVILEADPAVAHANTTQKLGNRIDEMAWIQAGEGGRVYSQAVSAYRIYCEQEGMDFDTSLEEVVGGTRFYRINYADRLEHNERISTNLTTLFAEELWSGEELVDDPAQAEAMQRKFAGTFVFVGNRTTLENDYFQTPLDVMFGVDTIALSFNTLLDGDRIRVVRPVNLLLVCLALALLAWLINQLRPVRNIWIAGITVMLLIVLANLLLFARAGIELSFTMSTLGFALPMFSCFFYNAMSDELAARRIRNLFGRYVASEVVEQIVRDPSLADLGGVERTAAVMFNDIRGFSTISEQLSAAQVVEFLNLYWGVVNDIVIRNHGWINKFLGDGMVACFGGPVPTETPVDDAVRTAVQMVRALQQELWPMLDARGLPRFQVGIGINVGRVIMGNIGSDLRQEYTVIGDAANVASRVESQTKEYGWSILVTQSVVDKAGEGFEFRFVGSQQVKGRSEEVRFYAVVDTNDEQLFRLKDM